MGALCYLLGAPRSILACPPIPNIFSRLGSSALFWSSLSIHLLRSEAPTMAGVGKERQRAQAPCV